MAIAQVGWITVVTGVVGATSIVTVTEFNNVTVQVFPNLIAFIVRVVALDNADEVKTILLPVPNFEIPVAVAPLNN